MARILFFLAACTALTVGCARRNGDTTLYQTSGRAKPIVAVLPVIDSTEEKLVSWDVSREITEEIRKKVFVSPKLYLLREGGSVDLAEQLLTPTPKELSKSLSQKLGAAEFIVVAELMDQKTIPYGFKAAAAERPYLEEVGAVLNLALRVRVIDVRADHPRVILQEVLNHEQMVGRPYINCDYSKAKYGTEAFERTPLGMAHNKIVRELVARVEGYVGASKG